MRGFGGGVSRRQLPCSGRRVRKTVRYGSFRALTCPEEGSSGSQRGRGSIPGGHRDPKHPGALFNLGLLLYGWAEAQQDIDGA
jgi:hypothetical protein